MPIEIWRMIFHFAAAEPCDAFDTSPLPTLSTDMRSWNVSFAEKDETPVEHRRVDTEERHVAYTARLSLRRNLVLACRFWHHSAMELLYECVVLHLAEAILSFAKALGKYSVGISEIPHTFQPTLYTKRLQLGTNRRSGSALKIQVDLTP
jgi:hypothetical protein